MICTEAAAIRMERAVAAISPEQTAACFFELRLPARRA